METVIVTPRAEDPAEDPAAPQPAPQPAPEDPDNPKGRSVERRLAILEAETQRTEAGIARLKNRIQQIEERLAKLEKAAAAPKDEPAGQVEELKEEVAALKASLAVRTDAGADLLAPGADAYDAMRAMKPGPERMAFVSAHADAILRAAFAKRDKRA